MAATVIDRLEAGDHVCWAFDDDAAMLDTAVRFVSTGISAGEKVLCYLDQVDPDELVDRASQHGVDAAVAVSNGQASFLTSAESYLSGDGFTPDEVLDGWRSEVRRSQEQGYLSMRVVADMSWAFRSAPAAGAEQLAWYEAQANRVFAGGFANVICLYDRRDVPETELDRITMAHQGYLDANNGNRCPLVRIRHTTDPVGVRISGEADLATREALIAVVSGLANDLPVNGDPITVQVSNLTFADGTTAQMLVRAARAAPAGLRIVGASATLARLIDLVGGHEVPGLTVHVNGTTDDSSGEGSEQI